MSGVAQSEHDFQAEINDLMSLMINTLYTNKACFVRELISNASDAIDKDRQLRMSAGKEMKKGYKIQVIPNKSERTLVFRDNGIGMTRDEVIQNLGTIAKSGTKEFLKKIRESSPEAGRNLIGQFGVGFYSSFLVADKVVVYTNKDDKRTMWSSEANGKFVIEDCGECSDSGTEVHLEIKEVDMNVLEENVLKQLIQQYSGYVGYPVELEVTMEKAVGEVKELVTEFQMVNTDKPLWQRSPSEVTDEEYNAFYKNFTGDSNDPLAKKHFHVEGDVDAKCLMFISKIAPANLFESNRDILRNVVLFSKGVFVTSESTVLSPGWMIFATCIVDCYDVPLNVGREFLQDAKITEVIRKTISKRALKMVSELNEEDTQTFHESYSKCLKIGILNRANEKDELLKVMRFVSSTDDKLISLEEYCGKMAEGQESIYFCCGTSIPAMKKSTLIKKFQDNGLSVILLDDTIDDNLMNSIEFKFEGKTLKCVNVMSELVNNPWEKESGESGESDPEYDKLCEVVQNFLGEEILKVTQTTKSGIHPVEIKVPDKGLTGHQETVMSAQTTGLSMQTKMRGKKVVNLNVKSGVIQILNSKVKEKGDFEDTDKALFMTLYNTALINGGYVLPDPYQYTDEIFSLIESVLSGKPPAPPPGE
jgi:molecular chaperone HtpG